LVPRGEGVVVGDEDDDPDDDEEEEEEEVEAGEGSETKGFLPPRRGVLSFRARRLAARFSLRRTRSNSSL
jgi:hypothetical protein